MIGKMKNYIIIKAKEGGQESTYQTKTVPGDKLKPIVWNETINIPCKNPSNLVLQVTVMDKDMVWDDVNGVGKINVERCLMTQGDGSYQLRLYGKTQQDYAGDVYFKTRFSKARY